MKLKKLLEGVKITGSPCLPEVNITSLSFDSNAVKKGGLFVAIKGLKRDGHKFVKMAFKKGAVICVVNGKSAPGGDRRLIRVRDTRGALSVISKNFYRSPSEKLKVVGITGTNGKTTASFLIKQIFESSRMPCGVIGTVENSLGKRRIPATMTTPDSLTINALLDKMLRSGLKASVMEVSSHALHQKRVDDIFFDAALFTNITREHLDYHGSMERYFADKIKIFAHLKKHGVAVINFDDERLRRLKKSLRCKCLTYGLNKNADITARPEKIGLDGSSFSVRINKKKAFSVNTKLPGLHNISNILAAIAVSFSQGIDQSAMKKGIEKVCMVRGRLEPVRAGQAFRVFVDYAHTDDALEVVLKFLARVKSGRIITVFGCGGDRDWRKRPIMGRIAQEFSDSVIITNDNPRTENPAKIIRGITGGMDKRKGNYSVVPNRRIAIQNALKKAGKDDIVLIAGKGHEAEQISGKRSVFFDDKKVAEEWFNLNL